MKIRKYIFSIGRLVLGYFKEGQLRRYAIEVDADHADEFDMPGAAICDSWDSGDGAVVFVIQSRTGVAALIQSMKGVRSVSLLSRIRN